MMVTNVAVISVYFSSFFGVPVVLYLYYFRITFCRFRSAAADTAAVRQF